MNIYSKTTNSPQVSDTSHYTPELRFPGFKGNWEVKKISDLYERHIEKNNLTFREDSIISVANMYYKKDSTISDETYLKTYNVFRLNDIAFEGNKSASHAYGRFVQNTIGDGIVSHVFEVFRPISSNMYPLFWSYYINYERVMCPILEKSTKKTTMMTNLVAKDFLKQTILVPTLAEQQKIADCLSSLDEEIAAEAQKADALKDHKKGLMQQLFPQPGQTTPQRRFPGFEGEWEASTISDIFEIRNGYTPSKRISEYWEGGTIPWFRMEDIRENGGILADAIQHITPLGVKGKGLFKKNSIILATTATIGIHAMLIADSLANQQFTNFSIRESLKHLYSPIYVYYAFFGIDEWCKKNTNAGGLLSVNMPSLLKQPFPTPTLAEQQKIADCLSELDEMISAQQQKVEALKEHKKGLMQKLFPKIN